MAQVKFGRGSKTHEQYKTSIEGYTYDSNMIYFNTSTNQIYLGDSVFGVSSSDSAKFNNAFESVSYDNSTHTITFTQHDGTTDQVVVIPLASAAVAGLMSPAHFEAVQTTFPAALNELMGEATVEGSVKKALADAKSYTDDEIQKLDADKSDTSTDGHVTVQVVEVDGKIDSVAVTTSDIASANTLSNLSSKVGTVAEGETVVGMIADAKAEAKTEIAAKTTGHITISSSPAEDGHVIYTFSENNIAKADELDTLEASVGAAGDMANASGSVYARIAALVAEDGNLDLRLDALEGENGALATAKKYTDDEIAKLDATVGSQVIAEGKHVAVEVVETNGVLTALYVVEDDIASAAALGTLSEKVNAFLDAEGIKNDTLDTLKEIQDYITSEAGAADQMVKDIAANKEAIEEEVTNRENAIKGLNSEKASENGSFVNVTVKQEAGVITSVSVSEDNIASAAELDALEALVGTDADGAEASTAFGKIAAETAARTQAVNTINGKISEIEGTIASNKTAAEEYADNAVKALKEGEVADNAADIAQEIKDRQAGDEAALNAANAYTDTALTWFEG